MKFFEFYVHICVLFSFWFKRPPDIILGISTSLAFDYSRSGTTVSWLDVWFNTLQLWIILFCVSFLKGEVGVKHWSPWKILYLHIQNICVILLADKLKLKGASEYNFLNQSDSLEIHNVDDAKKFHMLVVSSRDQIG